MVDAPCANARVARSATINSRTAFMRGGFYSKSESRAQNSEVRFHIALASLLLFAQDLRFHEKIEVRLIEVNAVVTDREGHRVYGLTADDFEIYEGRAKQPITNFTEYRAPSEPLAAAPATAAEVTRPASHAREPHSILLLVDSLPRTDFVREKTFQQIEGLLAKISRGGDHVSIVYWDPRYQRANIVAESSDAKAVMAAFRDFAMQVKPDTGALNEATSAAGDVRAYSTVQRGAAGRSPIDFSAQRDASKMIAQEERLGVLHRKTASLERLVNALGARPGKKAVVYVSDDFRLEGEAPAYASAKHYIDEITRAANAGGVTFYAVHSALVADPQDASSDAHVDDNPQAIDNDDVLRTSGALQRLTDPTGGLLDLNRNSVATLAPLIAEDLESYYSLAYQSKSDGDDRVRNITVKTKNPAYRVRSRTAVVQKSAATQARETVVSRLFVD